MGFYCNFEICIVFMGLYVCIGGIVVDMCNCASVVYCIGVSVYTYSVDMYLYQCDEWL